MLILTKQRKDYYDGVAQTTGIDKTIVYDRQLVEFDRKEMPNFFTHHTWEFMKNKTNIHYNNLSRFSLTNNIKYEKYSHFIVGFCGKLYVGWKLYLEISENYSKKLITEITYDVNLIKSITKESKFYGNIEDHIKYISTVDNIDIFRKYKTPIFVYDSDCDRTSIGHLSGSIEKFLLNPTLKDYEFYKIFDAFQAFQEIQMFLGGVLGSGEKEMVQIEDKYKIVQHGFDLKTSFRKDKSK